MAVEACREPAGTALSQLIYLARASTPQQEATSIQTWLCKLSRSDGRTYYLNRFNGTLDDVQRIGFEIEHLYRERKAKT